MKKHLMNTVENVVLASLLLISCSKQEDFTYLQAKINGTASTMQYIEATSTVSYLENDTTKYYSIYGVDSKSVKILLEIQIDDLFVSEYLLGTTPDKKIKVKATYEKDAVFYSTNYNTAYPDKGKITITKIESGYIKGIFEFTAFTKDLSDSIKITDGKFYSEMK